MSPRTRSLLLLHGVVVIFGFTGILGKLISIEAEPLVFWRVTLGGLTTALYLMIRRKWVAWDVLSALKAGGIGWIVAAHWVTFFASIKASSVGLALTMLATAPLFVGLIEPLVYKRKLAWRELAVAALVFVGIALVFQAEQDQTLGILLGLASSVLAAVFSTLNGVMVRQHDPINLSAVELLSASLGMVAWLTVQEQFDATLFSLSFADWLWVGLLAVVATSFAFMVSIQVLKDLTPFESAMAINLEPIYAIVLAYILFGERFSPGFYAGAALVIGAVFLDTLLRSRKPEKGTTPPDHP
jgi:drug/metabolite transporter (DMT)-like permease